MGINLITRKFSICMAPAYYDSLDTKLNNTTGDVSIAIKNNYGVDVAGFSNNATKYVELKCNCNVYNKLNVLGNTTLGNTLTIPSSSSGGGSIKVVAFSNNIEASIGLYNYTDMRVSSAVDMWVAGESCWGLSGSSIGSPVLHSCLTINNNGGVNIPYELKTHEIMVDQVKALNAEHLIVGDSVMITGALVTHIPIYRYHNTSAVINSSQLITIAQMLSNIILCTSSIAVIYTLPTASNIQAGRLFNNSTFTTPINQGFEWSILNMGSSAGAISISTSGSTHHSCWGNTIIDINKSGRFVTKMGSNNLAYTYRLS